VTDALSALVESVLQLSVAGESSSSARAAQVPVTLAQAVAAFRSTVPDCSLELGWKLLYSALCKGFLVILDEPSAPCMDQWTLVHIHRGKRAELLDMV
jgi:hypothetical protein